MSCRDACCGGGVASWTYDDLTGATELSLAAGTAYQAGAVDVFTMTRTTGVRLTSRGCPGTCGGALYLDVMVQGRTGIVAVAVEIAQGLVAADVAVPGQFTDWRMVQPGSSLAACQTQLWRFPVLGRYVNLQVSNYGTGAITMDLFSVFRNA